MSILAGLAIIPLLALPFIGLFVALLIAASIGND